MRIGLFMTPQWQPGADLGRGCEELMEQARAARSSGFASIFVGQHMVTGPGMQMLQTVPLMARLLPEIEGMQIGPGVMLLPMLSPVMVAEEGATIDWMSGGNYVLAGGLGYREEEFEAMGSRKSQRASRLSKLLDWFEDERKVCGLPTEVACPIMRECFVGRDMEHARAISRGPLLYKYEAYASWGHNDTQGAGLSADFDAFCADRFLIGDKATVRDEILRYAEAMRTDHLILRGQWPGLDQQEALGNIERIGEVIASL